MGGAAKLVLKVSLSMKLEGKSLDLGLRLANCEPVGLIRLQPVFVNKVL